MDNVLVQRSSLENAANSIRAKLGTQDLIAPEDFATNIDNIPSGGEEKDYGTVTIADYSINWTTVDAWDCTITVNSTLFQPIYEQHAQEWDPYGEGMIYCQYNEPNWRLGYSSTETYTSAELAEMGLTVTTTSTSASARLKYDYVVDPTQTTDYPLTDVYEYKSLGKFTSDERQNIYINNQPIPRAIVVGYVFGEDCDFIPEYFLQYCSNFNSNITIPDSFTAIPQYFLYYCTSFNSDVIIPSSVTEIGNFFCSNCSSLNRMVTIPSSVTKIGADFYYYCTSFAQNVSVPGTVIEIGAAFLSYSGITTETVTINSGTKYIKGSFLAGSSFNGTLNLPNTLEEIGPAFLSQCRSFNQVITLPNSLKTIGNNFLYGCTAYNQAFSIGSSSHITEIGNNFMNGCSSLASTVDMSSATSIKKIGDNYLSPTSNTSAFFNGTSGLVRMTKAIPPRVEEIGNYFFASSSYNAQCGINTTQYSFNFPYLKKVGNNFLYRFMGGCNISFGALESVGNYFMANTNWYDRPVTFPSTLKTIGTYAFSNITLLVNGFDITIPSSVTSIGGYFMYNNNRRDSSHYLIVNCDYSVFGTASANYILSTTLNTSPSYTNGVNIKGSSRSSWLTNLPNRTSSPYRNLVDAGA